MSNATTPSHILRWGTPPRWPSARAARERLARQAIATLDRPADLSTTPRSGAAVARARARSMAGATVHLPA